MRDVGNQCTNGLLIWSMQAGIEQNILTHQQKKKKKHTPLLQFSTFFIVYPKTNVSTFTWGKPSVILFTNHGKSAKTWSPKTILEINPLTVRPALTRRTSAAEKKGRETNV